MTTTVTRTITLAEMHAEARARFGEDWNQWAYQCPACGDIANITDVRLALAVHEIAFGPHGTTCNRVLGQACTSCGAAARDHGTTIVRTPDGRTARVFELAPKP